MNNFLKWFFVFISTMLQGFGEIFLGFGRGIKQIFDIPTYIALFRTYCGSFSVLEWVCAILGIILVIAVYVLLAAMLVLAVRKYLRFRHSIVSNEDLLEEISVLQRRVMKLMKEKDEIMALKVTQMGLSPSAVLSTEGGTITAVSPSEDGQTPAGEAHPAAVASQDGVIQTADMRFSKLIEVDNFYKTYEPPEYDDSITLEGFVDRYRNFACSRMHLYYDHKTIRLFLAGMA